MHVVRRVLVPNTTNASVHRCTNRVGGAVSYTGKITACETRFTWILCEFFTWISLEIFMRIAHMNFTSNLFHVNFTWNCYVSLTWNSFHVNCRWNEFHIWHHMHLYFTWIFWVKIYSRVSVSWKKMNQKMFH